MEELNQHDFEMGIYDALMRVVGIWANSQKDALDNAQRNVPILTGTNAIFQGAAWANLGMGGVMKLFPDHAVTTCLKKIAVPVAVASYIVDAFMGLNKMHVAKFNTMMLENYAGLKHKFKDAVNKAHVGFANTPFGRSILATLQKVLKKRMKDMDRYMLGSHCARMLMDDEYGVIETTSSEIYKRTKAGYLAICEKLLGIYKGTKYSLGTDKLIRLDLSKVRPYSFKYGNTEYPASLFVPEIRNRSTGEPEQITVCHGPYQNNPEFAWVLNNAWHLEVKVVKPDWWRPNPWHEPQPSPLDDIVYVWPSVNRPIRAMDLATNLTKKGRFVEYEADLIAADQKLWPETLRQSRIGA